MNDETLPEEAEEVAPTDGLRDAEQRVRKMEAQGWVWRGDGVDKVLSHPDDHDLNVWFHPYSGELLLSPKLVERLRDAMSSDLLSFSAKPPTPTKEERIGAVIRAYIKARRDLFAIAAEYPQQLGGNDNIIGRIGEYIAIRYLGSRFANKARCKSQAGHDLICVDGKRISVKCITAESESGRSARLTEPWDEFILIELDESYEACRLGHLTREQFERACQEDPSRGRNPFAKREMLRPTGLIGRYGTVADNYRW
jgi:hypothetical protein